MSKIRLGKRIGLISILFSIIETIYFGFNWLPESISEAICDSISLIGMSIAILLIIYGKRENRNRATKIINNETSRIW